jgi:hypothetical protein
MQVHDPVPAGLNLGLDGKAPIRGQDVEVDLSARSLDRHGDERIEVSRQQGTHTVGAPHDEVGEFLRSRWNDPIGGLTVAGLEFRFTNEGHLPRLTNGPGNYSANCCRTTRSAEPAHGCLVPFCAFLVS